MNTLKDTQQRFMDYILAGEGELPEQLSCAAGFKTLIQDQAGIDADTRAQIYANAYRSRLRETIETDHEMLGLYLGDDLFEQMVQGYIAAQPSRFRSLRQFCDALPQFLMDDEFFQQYPVIADIAAFERRLLSAFDAEDSQRASFEELQVVPAEQWPGIKLRFHASVQLFQCNSNAVESWQALKAEEVPPQPDYSGTRLWLLWRGEERLTEFISLSEDQLVLLEGFIKGHDFAQQCELMLQWYSAEEAPMEVVQAIQAWFQMGLIRRVELS